MNKCPLTAQAGTPNFVLNHVYFWG